MKPKTIITISFFLFSSKIFAQFQPIYYADYSYADRHLLRGGLEFMLTNNTKNHNKLFLGTGYGMVNYNGKIHGIPDLHVSYNVETLLFAKLGSSNYHANSLIGISVFNTVDLGIGYSFPYKNSSVKIQGFTIGATIRFTKKDDVYGKLKIGF